MAPNARKVLVAFVLTVMISASFATTVLSSSIVSAAFSGGAGTAVISGTLFARTGASLTLTIQTDAATQCVALTGAHTASSTTPSATGPSEKTWAFASTAVNGGDGVRTTTVSAYDDAACAGNAATTSANYTVDNTAPTVVGTKSPAPNIFNWNNTDITIQWTATDGGSGVASGPTPASDSQTVNTGSLLKSSTATDHVGNVGTGQITVRLDKDAPIINAALSPAANASGWNITNVTVSFVCSDGRSGIRTCSGPTTLTTEGAGQTVSGSALDFADNTNSAVVTVNIDKVAPTLSGAPVGSPNSAGWYNSDVVVDWTCDDGFGSGFAGGVCDDSVIDTEGVGLTASRSVVDLAGNSSSVMTSSPAVNLDTTAPSISAAASPVANSNGWNNGPVVVDFACADSLSGVASCSASATLSGEGAGQGATGHAADVAGNTNSASLSGVNIDLTPPVVSVAGVADGGTYAEGAWSATCASSDSLSGVATSASLGTSGGPLGVVTLTCAGATDRAGNAASPVSVSITVTGDTGGDKFDFGGFKRPLVGDALNDVKAGAAVPVRFSLGGYRGMDIFATGSPASAAFRCGSAPPTTASDRTATANAKTLTYDAASDTYSFVWKTDRSWTGCRVLVLAFVDGSTHSVRFRFR